MSYQCQICNKIYREKFNYDRHITCCEFFHRSRREMNHEMDIEDDVLPSKKEMYFLMQEMGLKLLKLEVEVKKLKQVQNKKMDVLEWLNKQQKQPEVTLNDWIINSVFPEIQYVLDTVYNEDLLRGYKALFQRVTDNQTDLPIRAFDNKSNQLYIYEKVPISVNAPEVQYHWRKIKHNEMERLLSKIDHQFIVNFRIYWYDVNKEHMEKESYKEMYINNYTRILGGDRMSDSTRHNHIIQYIYGLLKQTVKGFVEI